MQLLMMAAGSAPAAGGFDVDQATQAYMAMVQGAARARSDAYFEGGYWLLLWNALLSVLINWALLHFGWSARWSAWARRVGKGPTRRVMLYVIPYLLVTTLILLPWSLYTGYFREHQYGLSNLSMAGWFGEEGKDLLVNLVVGPLIIAGIFAVIRRAPRSWWVWGALVMTSFTALGALVFPVLIAPLFNQYTPMQPGPLRDQILAMAHAQHIPADNIYVSDASRQSDRISANVSGLGPTVRITLNDNLLKRVSPPGVKAVMGHEMGHYMLNHVVSLIGEFALVWLLVFFLLWWLSPRLLKRHAGRWKVSDPADPAALPLYVALGSAIMLLLTPVTNSITRVHEIEADAFGLDAAREPDGFAGVSMMLGEYRKLQPGRLEEIIFFDHPSGYNRVRRSMEWKAQHLNELPPEQRGIMRPAPLPAKF
ncbi:M48 family metallopeptidase [Sphingomonas sp. KRR8]|uniref:M48 family metallopeptidase n=1 Tax=Sphingomonas sp. KRR8 TaxID=2942996 RepID=UPI0020223106|nr:M48 family metallopeptidase [Sphingomonas sp. KRR8]URD59965.1 M48 family metallopeptidase [Sphingomonas sp. KRR8]